MFKIQVQIQSGPAGSVRQIWMSGPVWSGNSYAQSGSALEEIKSLSLLPYRLYNVFFVPLRMF